MRNRTGVDFQLEYFIEYYELDLMSGIDNMIVEVVNMLSAFSYHILWMLDAWMNVQQIVDSMYSQHFRNLVYFDSTLC